MKKIYMMMFAVLAAMLGFQATAQVNSYVFSQSSGTYTPITGGTVVAVATNHTTSSDLSLDQGNYPATIPFPFNYNGINYTTVNCQGNGYLTFGATLPTTTTTTPISSTTGYDGAIAPMARDLWGVYGTPGTTTNASTTITAVSSFKGIAIGKPIRGTGIPANATITGFDIGAGTITLSAAATSTNAGTFIAWPTGEIRAETLGTAPNRTFVVQYSGFADWITSVPNNNNFDFQVHLSEGTNVISFVYGPYTNLNTTARTSQVGLRGIANTDFNNRSSTTNWAATTAGTLNSSTVTRTNTIFPASGLTFTWTPSTVSVDWCNLQWPPTATINFGDSVLTFTQAYEPGVTEAAGAGANLTAWIGTNTTNTDPATWPPSAWKLATFNVQVLNNDEDSTSIGRTLAPGTYYYASRWQLSGGQYKYGGYNVTGGGYWDGVNNVSGVLTVNPPNMAYVSSTTTQSSTATVAGGSTNQQIIRVEVVVNGTNTPLSLTQLDLSTNGSTNAAGDITAARVYYTGTSTTFATTTQFGTTVSNPNGAYIVTGSQVLTGGLTNTTNYFWVVYDIACAATATNVVDGEATSLTVTTPRTPTVTAPTGTRAVVASTAGTFNTVADGPWSSASTWSCGNIPTSTNAVNINHNITVNAPGAASGNLTIATAGQLTIVAGGDLTIGNSAPATAKNNSFTNNGQFTISGGSLRVNGNLVTNLLSTFNQSGGSIVVDGNDAGATATSVAASTAIVSLRPSTLSSINFTGGTFTIVDPHAGASSNTLAVDGAIAGEINATTNHTFIFGDGVSSDGGGTAAYGFRINPWVSTTGISFGNIVLNGPAGTNRQVTTTYLTIIKGDFTINAGATLNLSQLLGVGGNFVNNGTFLALQTIYFGRAAYISASAITASASFVPQSISGSGVFQNLAASPTANLTAIEIYNGSAAGFTFNLPISLSGTFYLDSGIVNTTAVNLLTVGVSGTAAGTISRTNGWVNGPLKKWFPAALATVTLPLGNATLYKPATINFTSAPTTAGSLTARFSSAAPNFPNAAPLMEGALVINRASTQGSWFVDAGDGLTGGLYTGTFTGNGSIDIIDYTKTVLIKRPSAGGDWTLDGTHVPTTGSNQNPVVSRTVMANFSEFAIGGEVLVALPIAIDYFRGTKQTDRNLLDWKVTPIGSPTVTMVLERSADGRRYNEIYGTTETAARCQSPFAQPDLSPLPGLNYYRLKTIDIDGKINYSNVVVLLNKEKGFEIVSLAPNPVVDKAVLNVTSAEKSTMEIIITDIHGKQISKQRVNLMAGNNQVPLSLKTMAAGTYQVSGFTPDGEKKTLRFVKQ